MLFELRSFLFSSLVLITPRPSFLSSLILPLFPRLLPSTEPPSKSAYILMSLITPPPHLSNFLLRSVKPSSDQSPLEDHSAEEKEVISELGVYGVALFGKEEGVVYNDGKVGTLLRTKGRESDEGGVAVGFSVLDSVVLV